MQLDPQEKVTAVIPIKDFNVEDGFLLLVTKKGTIKKTKLNMFDTSRKTGLIAIKLADDDELISVKKTDGTKDIFIVTKKGKAIRFNEKDVRDMGRNAAGVRAIKISKKDSLVSMDVLDLEKQMLSITERGFGKMTSTEEYRCQTRGGKGVKTYKISEKTGDIIDSIIIEKEDELMLISQQGSIIRMQAADISSMGRDTQGVRVMKLNNGDKVVSVAKIIQENN